MLMNEKHEDIRKALSVHSRIALLVISIICISFLAIINSIHEQTHFTSIIRLDTLLSTLEQAPLPSLSCPSLH